MSTSGRQRESVFMNRKYQGWTMHTKCSRKCNRFARRWMWVGDKQTGFDLQVTSATESTQGEFNFKVSDEYDVEKAVHPFEVKHGSK